MPLSIGIGLGLANRNVGSGRVALPDATNYVKSGTPYSAYLGDFAKFTDPSLTIPADYQDTLYYDPITFPAGSRLDWRWPNRAPPAPLGVWAFLTVANYGNYDGGSSSVVVSPRVIGDLTSYTQSFDWTYTGSANFGLLTEVWLTRDKRANGAGTHAGALWEVGFLLFASDTTFHNSGTLVGTSHVNNGVTYTARRHGGSPEYITFHSGGSVFIGAIDWKAALNFLVTSGLLTGSEWVNGLGFGVEPKANAGSGSTTINSYSAAMTGNTGAPTADFLGTDLFGATGATEPSWSFNGPDTVVTGVSDMDGGTTATALMEGASTTTHERFKVSTTVPTTQQDYVWMEDLRNDKGRDAIILFVSSSDFASQFRSMFNLSSYAMSTFSSTGAGITLLDRQVIDLGGGWRRVILRFRKAAGITALFVSIGITDGTTNSYPGDITKGLTFRPRHRLVQVA